MKHPILSSLAVVAFAAAASSAAQAQTSPAPRKVDREELRYCLERADDLKTRSEGLKARSAQLNTLNEQLKAEGDEIQQELERQEKNSSMLGAGRDRLDRRKACCTVASRTAARSPSNFRVSLLSRPSTWNPNHTVPTGLSGVPPVGPATPVTATLTCARECRTAPNAIARATTSLTAPCAATRSGSTPSASAFASLE